MLTKLLVLSALAFGSAQVLAIETVGMRGLQIGPSGEGLVFAPVTKTEAELNIEAATLEGEKKNGNITTKFKGQTIYLTAATGFTTSESLAIQMQLDHQQHQVDGTSSLTKTNHESTASEFRIGPSFWRGDFLFGVHGSALYLGEETLSSGSDRVKTDAVTIPRLRLFTGVSSGSVAAMAKTLLYNHGSTTRTSSSPSGDTKRNIKRRTAAESSIDTHIQFTPAFGLAGSVTFVDAERVSDDNKNSYFTYGVGGLYRATAAVSLAGGMHYTDPFYKRASNASIIDDNLGGLRLDIGTRYKLESTLLSFGAGYVLPENTRYQTGTSRSIVKLKRTIWVLALGISQNLN